WRLRLRGSERLQGRHLLEGLDQQHKDVEVECKLGRHYINPAPVPGEVKEVACKDGNCQNHQGENSQLMGGEQPVKRKPEPGQAGEGRGNKEESSPAVKPLGVEHSKQHSQTGDDAYQAEHHVDQRVRLRRYAKDHDLSFHNPGSARLDLVASSL